MRFRKLRIAWSVLWGVGAALLIVLWVRSYWQTEFLERVVNVNPLYASGDVERIMNRPGSVEFLRERVVNSHSVNYTPPGWTYRAYAGVVRNIRNDGSAARRVRFRSPSIGSFPHYLAVLLVGGVGVGPWIRLRYSLRTLLFATTLVAVVLGLVVWLR